MIKGTAKIVVIIMLLVLLTQVLADSQRPQPPKTRRIPVPESEKQRIAGGLASSFGLGAFQPSLEMKENTDFFLTPALLVQEAISEDVIITYPTE
jgi:hypothetical protein